MSLPVRVGTLLVAFLAVVGGAIFVVIHFLLAGPPVIVAQGSGQQVNLVLQEDPQNGVTNHPDWVSYFIQDPKTRQWVHTMTVSSSVSRAIAGGSPRQHYQCSRLLSGADRAQPEAPDRVVRATRREEARW